MLCDYRRSDMVNCRAPLGGRHMALKKIRDRVRRTCTTAVMAFSSARLEQSVSTIVHRGSNGTCIRHRIAHFWTECDRYYSLRVSLQTSNFICLFPRFYLLFSALYLEFYYREFGYEKALSCEVYRK